MKSRFLYFLACVFIYFVPLIFILLLSAQNVCSLEVTLAWDSNSEEELVATYRIFYRKEGQSYDYKEPAWEGSKTTCTIYNLDDNTTYYFIARAFDTEGVESSDSNETCYAALSDYSESNDSDEAYYAALSDYSESSNSNETCYTALSGIIEIGEVSVDHNWKWVGFNDMFIDPVVVANSLSYNGGEPAVVRIQNVDSTGFYIRIQEWDYLNGIHITENISYIVMERGNYILEDGTKIEAESFDTDATGSFGWVGFSKTFNRVPVVTSSVSSFNEEDAVCSRLKNIDTTGFDFCMQEQELNRQIHTIETISYIAWEPSSGTVGDLTFEINKTDDVITHNLQTIVYNENFLTSPVFLADMQTTDGSDTANLCWQNKDSYGIDIKITEEQSRDSEITHITEVVGYMVVAKIKTDVDTGGDRLTDSKPAFTLEIGEVQVDHNWKRIELNNTFIDPVVVANSLSYNGGDPAVVRIQNVDSTGFYIRIQEWDYLNEIHITENVSYVVIERGSYILEDGTKIEAGKFDTDATGSFEWSGFSETFNRVPVVTSSVSSFNEEDAVCCRLKNINNTGFDFCMQEQELNRQIHTTETISYIAWEPSSGTVGNLTFEINKTDDVITHNLQTIVYNENFVTTPVFLADMQTTDGNNTANLRWQNKDFDGIDIKITEEQSRDSEIIHITEVVGYMIFVFIE